MKANKYVHIVIAMVLFINNLYAADEEKKSTLLPKHYVIQYAGNLGLLSTGFGNKIINDKIFAGLMYGYLPKSENDVEAHTLAIKLGYIFWERNIKSSYRYAFYIGTGIAYTITKNTFVELPTQYPDGYYKPNAIHLLPFVGLQFGIKINNQQDKYFGLYLELGSSDDYLFNYLFKNSRYKNSLLNVALGFVLDL